MRAARSAWMVAGTASSAASGSSPSMASICSTKSGCLRRVNDAIAERGAIPRSCISPSIRSIDSVSFSWASATRLAWPRRGPRRTDVEEVGTRETEEQDRRPLEKPRTLEQVEHRRICPVDVVHHHDEVASRRASRRAAGTPAVSSGEPGSSCAPIAPRMRRVATGPRSTFARRASRPASGSAPATSLTTSASGR